METLLRQTLTVTKVNFTIKTTAALFFSVRVSESTHHSVGDNVDELNFNTTNKPHYQAWCWPWCDLIAELAGKTYNTTVTAYIASDSIPVLVTVSKGSVGLGVMPHPTSSVTTSLLGV